MNNEQFEKLIKALHTNNNMLWCIWVTIMVYVLRALASGRMP